MTIAPGLCSITLRSLAADEVLDVAVRAGVEGIEWGADGHAPPGGGSELTALSARCRDAGVEVVSYGSYLGFGPPPADDESDVNAVLESAQALGAPMVRIWTELGVTPDSPADDRQRVVERTAIFVDAIAAHGLTAAVEFHPWTLTHTADSANVLLDSLPDLKTHWQPDPALSTTDALAELGRVTHRLAHLHVFTWGPEGIGARRALDDGAALWPSAFAIAARNAESFGGLRYALCEYVRDDDPEQLVADVRTLRRWIEEIEESSDERTQSL
jgi:sugar phosphate isomerase/epimerase